MKKKKNIRINEKGLFWCPSCKMYLPIDKFHKSKNRKYGIDSRCAKCINKKKKTTYKKVLSGSVKIEFLDRGNLKNFIYYFSKSQYHFKDIFGIDFTLENAEIAYSELFKQKQHRE